MRYSGCRGCTGSYWYDRRCADALCESLRSGGTRRSGSIPEWILRIASRARSDRLELCARCGTIDRARRWSSHERAGRGFEPKLELAVIKIEGEGYPYFSLQDIPQPNTGDAVLGFSNAFGVATGPEPVTVMFGHLSAKSTLAGRRGYFKTPYEGSIYVLDLIANNPGAAGGALTDLSGRLLGMLGKELRDDRTGAWLNYAVPGEVLKPILRDIVAGKAPDVMPPQKRALPADRAQQLELLGIVLVPNVLDRTPAFIDQIKPESAAAKAGILADDLIVLVGDTRIDSQTTLKDLLARTDRQDRLSVVVQRGSQLLTLNISP